MTDRDSQVLRRIFPELENIPLSSFNQAWLRPELVRSVEEGGFPHHARRQVSANRFALIAKNPRNIALTVIHDGTSGKVKSLWWCDCQSEWHQAPPYEVSSTSSIPGVVNPHILSRRLARAWTLIQRTDRR